MNLSRFIKEILNGLDSLESSHTAFIGFDGYVDKIQYPVASENASGSVYYTGLESFGKHIIDAAGKSAQIELFTEIIKLGGNAPIMAQALASLGVQNTCIGTFGEKTIDPVFELMHSDIKLISLGKPGESNALEFPDGKLILSELSTFEDLDWNKIVCKIGLSNLRKIVNGVELIALVDWCNLPHATTIWKGVLNDLIIPLANRNIKVFFDLADISKKPSDQILELISLINEFGLLSEVCLGLNENEAICLYQTICRLKGIKPNRENISAIGKEIFDEMTINQLLIHPIDSCYLFEKEGMKHFSGTLVKPKVSTGGGDNFNAGFCFGLLNGFSKEASMILAMASSALYVRDGESPTIDSIKHYFLEKIN